MAGFYGRGSADESVPKSSGGMMERRFRMDPGQRRRIVLLDDAPFRIGEHEVWVTGRPAWFVCVRGWDGYHDCPLCDLAERLRDTRKVSYCRNNHALRLIDMTGYEKEGKKFTNIPRMVLFSPEDWEKLRSKRRFMIDEGKIVSLVGCVFSVFRATKRSSRIGDDWTFDKQVTKEEMEKAFGDKLTAIPEDLSEVFKALPHERLKTTAESFERILFGGKGNSEPRQSEGYENPPAEEYPPADDVPF